jgi:hypothetical protein
MASFSQRHGHAEVRSLAQRESLDADTRLEFWNLLAVLPTEFENLGWQSPQHAVLEALWVSHFKGARDELPSDARVWMAIKQQILRGPWNEVLDLLEAFAKQWNHLLPNYHDSGTLNGVFLAALNDRFEWELVGYRLIGLEITPVDSSAEAEAITGALFDVEPIAGARHSLERAVELLADRATPDYPNSVKESISAVEAVIRKLTGERTLSEGLKKLEVAGLTLHGALKEAWSKMYGWVSDEDGVRHGSINAANVDQALAKYILVTCSAFVSYLVEEGSKAKLL